MIIDSAVDIAAPKLEYKGTRTSSKIKFEITAVKIQYKFIFSNESILTTVEIGPKQVEIKYPPHKINIYNDASLYSGLSKYNMFRYKIVKDYQ